MLYIYAKYIYGPNWAFTREVPSVSIIIPAYNEERHIEKCLESLLAQDYQDIEILIIDNGSKDNTPKIVERYVERFRDKVRLLSMWRNLGPGGGRNLGASNASGEILVFVDADMVFPPDYISKLVKPIQHGKAQLTSHSIEYVANIDNPWVKVQGQTIRSIEKGDSRVLRAIEKRLFTQQGGFNPSLHYHDDRTFFYKTGLKATVIEEAYCYHNNPDTAKEIFRRNYLIGRTLLAVMHREHGAKGLLYATATASVRLLDLVALPLAAAWAVLSPANPLLNALFLAPIFAFTALTIRMKIVKAENLKEKIILRILYAPLYRIIRAAGLLTGVFTSLIFGLLVTSHETAKT
jgi:glycosyltransferase involved in cell wall biosynthesis